ncbi:BatA domain-containing protein [Nafulsella turpanensis]|uniref:BatA domain-containing protein n=1 Tax=Nafulsella turpanensis TaxID=1265690 RepID=UPI00034D76F6|nr:BatA domain-containing protein [Nafulsella turpanensis]
MPEIGQPLYLLAALGVLVPIAIHLWNRKPPRVVEVGSIRWFTGSVAPAAHRLQLKDFPLLLLRCLLLLVFSLLLAGLWVKEQDRDKENFYLWLIDSGLAHQFSEEKLDSFEAEGIRLRLLAPGLPPLADSALWKNRLVDIWGVMEEADQLSWANDSILVWSKLEQGQFSGTRPGLHHQFVFREQEIGLAPVPIMAEIIQLDSLHLIQQWKASEGAIKFKTDTLSAKELRVWREERMGTLTAGERREAITLPDTFLVDFETAETYQQDAQIIRYALEAAAAQIPGLELVVVEKDSSREADLLVWLQKDSLPAELAKSSTTILSMPPEQRGGEQWLRKAETAEGVYQLTSRPLFGVVEREKLQRLPLALLALFPDNQLAQVASLMPMPATQAAPVKKAFYIQKKEEEEKSLHKWLWGLIMVLFLMERVWVYRK